MSLKSKIEELLKVRGKTAHELIEVIDMSETGYYAMLRNNSMKVETLKKISVWLNVSPSVFLEFKGVENIEHSTPPRFSSKLSIQAQHLIDGIQKLELENQELKNKLKKQHA